MWIEFKNAYADQVVSGKLVMGLQISVNTEHIVFVRAKQKYSNTLTEAGQPDTCHLGIAGGMEGDEQVLLVHGTHDEIMGKIKDAKS